MVAIVAKIIYGMLKLKKIKKKEAEIGEDALHDGENHKTNGENSKLEIEGNNLTPNENNLEVNDRMSKHRTNKNQ
jgi:hypothetical protein